MKTLRRYDIRHAAYFITCVTYERRAILLNDIDLFWKCWTMPEPSAWVILPEHFHFILNIEDQSISDIMHYFKIKYSRNFRDRYGPGNVWQNRFWDHIIRDEDDMNRHIDYIHYNPVKHGLAISPFNYANSSFTAYFSEGRYGQDWGTDYREEEGFDFGE
ncbi:MAG: transposase [candidate division Zixibacteria bacterium]|nr:transposase [candidate division Zixibacteria bacterium]